MLVIASAQHTDTRPGMYRLMFTSMLRASHIEWRVGTPITKSVQNDTMICRIPLFDADNLGDSKKTVDNVHHSVDVYRNKRVSSLSSYTMVPIREHTMNLPAFVFLRTTSFCLHDGHRLTTCGGCLCSSSAKMRKIC